VDTLVPPVAVVSDTTGYVPQAILTEHGIHVVSLYVNWGPDRSEPEAALDGFDGFYDELRSAERLPTTSGPSLGDFVAVYEPLLAGGGAIVSVHLSSGLSGTCDVARQAARLLEQEGRGGERIRVVDSSTAAGALGLLALVGSRAAEAGLDAGEVAGSVESARGELKLWACLDTLEYLRRGGRIGGARAWIGSTLRVKPIITVDHTIIPVERVRTWDRAVERMVDYARGRSASGADAWMVQHVQARAQADELVARCGEVFGTSPAFVSEIGPVLGVHTGPGLLGLAALPSRFLS
jgi:DegV family protein with EDD domain